MPVTSEARDVRAEINFRDDGNSLIPVERVNPLPVADAGAKTIWLNHETISVGTSAVGLTPAIIAAHTTALITVEGGAVRFWPDASANPTASAGHALGPTDVLQLSDMDLTTFKFISRDGGTVTMFVTYGDRRPS
jgi:hypothetical protein